ncbi:MAG: type sorting protein, partial [Mucilaginibacter sp.]|nr:type sorting protein [Mucilaginibacter sp.]
TVVTKTITVKKRAKPVFQAPSMPCQGEAILFTDDSPANTDFTTTLRTWDFGDGESASSASQTVMHRYKNPGNYIVQLVLENAQGCLSDMAEKLVTILPKPTPDFDVPDICITDGTAYFSNKSHLNGASNAGLTYTWHFHDNNATPGNPDISTLSNPGHIFTEAKTYTIALTATSPDGCDSTITKELSVNGAPKADIELLTPQSLCSGQQVLLRDLGTVPGNGSITKLILYFNADEDPEDKLEVIHPQPQQVYAHTYAPFYSSTKSTVQRHIKVVAYSGISCSDEVSKNITLFSAPQLQFNQMDDVCTSALPMQINQAREISGIAGVNTFFSGRGVSATGTFDPAIAGAGIHTLTYHFTAASGCTDSISKPIRVLQAPSAELKSNIYILKGNSVTLKPDYQGENLTYKWSPAISLDNAASPYPRASPISGTTYNVEISNGVCSTFAQVNVNVLLPPVIYNTFTPNGDGVNDFWEIPNLRDYPNASVSVFNRYGIQVYHSTGYVQPWNGKYNDKDLPSATYYYIVKPGNGQSNFSGYVTIIR